LLPTRGGDRPGLSDNDYGKSQGFRYLKWAITSRGIFAQVLFNVI
jgi:hypothetical protein